MAVIDCKRAVRRRINRALFCYFSPCRFIKKLLLLLPLVFDQETPATSKIKMVVATRVLVPDCCTKLERRESPPCQGPSSVRISCTLSRKYSSRRLGGGRHAATDLRTKRPVTGEQTFFVYDSSIFLRYEDLRRAIEGMLASMPILQRVDLSPENWECRFGPEGLAATMLARARRDGDEGIVGAHYHFSVEMNMEVEFIYSEPKAVVRSCAENVMQTVELGSTHQCSICMEDFGLECCGDGDPMSPVNLPCSHPFHVKCITRWLFQGHTCPVCRHDLAGLVSAPWPWAIKYGGKQ